jgi:hypothetical protein
VLQPTRFLRERPDERWLCHLGYLTGVDVGCRDRRHGGRIDCLGVDDGFLAHGCPLPGTPRHHQLLARALHMAPAHRRKSPPPCCSAVAARLRRIRRAPFVLQYLGFHVCLQARCKGCRVRGRHGSAGLAWVRALPGARVVVACRGSVSFGIDGVIGMFAEVVVMVPARKEHGDLRGERLVGGCAVGRTPASRLASTGLQVWHAKCRGSNHPQPLGVQLKW